MFFFLVEHPEQGERLGTAQAAHPDVAVAQERHARARIVPNEFELHGVAENVLEQMKGPVHAAGLEQTLVHGLLPEQDVLFLHAVEAHVAEARQNVMPDDGAFGFPASFFRAGVGQVLLGDEGAYRRRGMKARRVPGLVAVLTAHPGLIRAKTRFVQRYFRKAAELQQRVSAAVAAVAEVVHAGTAAAQFQHEAPDVLVAVEGALFVGLLSKTAHEFACQMAGGHG